MSLNFLGEETHKINDALRKINLKKVIIYLLALVLKALDILGFLVSLLVAPDGVFVKDWDVRVGVREAEPDPPVTSPPAPDMNQYLKQKN